MRPLSLQNRLLLALVAAGIVPVMVFAAVAFALAGSAITARQASDLAALTRLAASQVGGASMDATTSGRVGGPTDRTRSLFPHHGRLLASPDASRPVPAPPAAVVPGAGPTTTTQAGLVIAYAALPSGVGIMAISEPVGGLPELAVPFLASMVIAVVLAIGLGLVL